MNFIDQAITEIPFDLPGKAYRSPMPFSYFDPLSHVWDAYLENNIKVVFVLTEQQEYLVRARRDLLEFYRSEGLDAVHVPIKDFQTPEDHTILEEGLAIAEESLRDGRNIAAHCMAGIGRTGIFLACLAKRILLLDGETAIDWLRQFIPSALENYRQERFVEDFMSQAHNTE